MLWDAKRGCRFVPATTTHPPMQCSAGVRAQLTCSHHTIDAQCKLVLEPSVVTTESAISLTNKPARHGCHFVVVGASRDAPTTTMLPMGYFVETCLELLCGPDWFKLDGARNAAIDAGAAMRTSMAVCMPLLLSELELTQFCCTGPTNPPPPGLGCFSNCV